MLSDEPQGFIALFISRYHACLNVALIFENVIHATASSFSYAFIYIASTSSSFPSIQPCNIRSPSAQRLRFNPFTSHKSFSVRPQTTVDGVDGGASKADGRY